MYGEVQTFLVEIAFDIVYHIVRFHYVAARIDFDVYRNVGGARSSVVVHHQIVYPEHSVVGHKLFTHVLDKFLRGRLSEQRTYGVFDEQQARYDYEKADGKTHISVDVDARYVGDYRGYKDCART